MSDVDDPVSQLRFSIVTAVYNVARYLDEFIESVEGQSFPRDQFEVIAVDDGSTDDSLSRLRAWEQRRPGLVRVLSKENGGQSSARNMGLDHARGQWVTFTDPDDVIRPDYLAEVAAFIQKHPAARMVATKFQMLNDETGAVTDAHPLRRRFHHGNRIRNLRLYPDHFHGSAPAAFFPMAELNRQGLRFDTRIRPNWEDGHFCSLFLLEVDEPAVGFVGTAHYLYRKRRDNTSTLQGSFADPGRFTTVLRHGYLDALERGAAKTESGLAPEWLQNLVVYELSWYFSTYQASAGARTAGVAQVAEEFHSLLRDVLRYIDKDVIAGYYVRPLRPEWTDILLHAYEDEAWHQDYALLSSFDERQSLVRISYRYSGEPPAEELISGGRVVTPRHAKVRSVTYFDRPLLFERIVWMSSRQSLRVRLSGRDVELRFHPRRHTRILRPGEVRSALGRRGPLAIMPPRPRATRIGDRFVRRLAGIRPVRRLFRRAWVLMDRIGDAGDSGERLFEFVRAHRPDLNAWFVVARDAPDWRRMRRQHGWRVLAHGSLRWKLAMANCRHLISSHIDVPIVHPPQMVAIREPAWQFTFLQHGVIKDDLSGWLNHKPIDLFVTSTPDEFASIAADHTPYEFTTKEVKLTGLPRFDRLLAMGEQFSDDRDLVLVAPTWRVNLVRPLRAGAHTREIDPAFYESEFARNWLGLLRSPELAALCEENGLAIGFLPHPVLQPALATLDLPAHVRPLTFADNDVQELFARSAVMVTDYSSMAFNAAYINRPLVYFQFDSAAVRAGEHLGRRGYFDYGRDGFGPVTHTLADAVATISDVIRGGRSPSPRYQSRIDAAFPVRDGRCSERVVAEIERLTRRLSAAEAAMPIPMPNEPSSLGPPTDA